MNHVDFLALFEKYHRLDFFLFVCILTIIQSFIIWLNKFVYRKAYISWIEWRYFEQALGFITYSVLFIFTILFSCTKISILKIKRIKKRYSQDNISILLFFHDLFERYFLCMLDEMHSRSKDLSKTTTIIKMRFN